MKRPGHCLIAFLMFLAAPLTAAHAQDAQTTSDLRCMAVMAKINQQPDTKHQLESLIGGYYFLGRLQAGAPGLNLGPETSAAYNKMSPAEFLSETTRCEQEMRTNGHTMTEIGGAMPKVQPGTGK